MNFQKIKFNEKLNQPNNPNPFSVPKTHRRKARVFSTLCMRVWFSSKLTITNALKILYTPRNRIMVLLKNVSESQNWRNRVYRQNSRVFDIISEIGGGVLRYTGEFLIKKSAPKKTVQLLNLFCVLLFVFLICMMFLYCYYNVIWEIWKIIFIYCNPVDFWMYLLINEFIKMCNLCIDFKCNCVIALEKLKRFHTGR